jgi:hypothetical protein
MPPAERTPPPALQALAELPGDGVAGRAHAELGLQTREPLGDRPGQPSGMLGLAEVLASQRPASGPESSISPSRSSSTTAVPGGGSSARARTRRPRACVARSAPSRPRAGDVEHLAVALGEPALGTPEPGDDRLAATGAHADRDLVLHACGAVELAAAERSPLPRRPTTAGRAPAGRMRREQRMVARVPDDRLECAGGLRPDQGPLVINGARGELDSIPGQDVRGNELRERLLRSDTGPAPQSIPFASRVRCLVALGACRRGTALRPGLLAAGPASNSILLSIGSARASFATRFARPPRQQRHAKRDQQRDQDQAIQAIDVS